MSYYKAKLNDEIVDALGNLQCVCYYPKVKRILRILEKNALPQGIISTNGQHIWQASVEGEEDKWNVFPEEALDQVDGTVVLVKIEEEEYRKLLERMANSHENVIFLGHLVSSLRLGEEIRYLDDRKIPKWFVDINDNLIQLVAPANLVSNRRKSDKGRKRSSEIEEIKKHQDLCTKEWNRISDEEKANNTKMHIIENIDLKKAVNDVEDIICEKDKNKIISNKEEENER